MNTTPKAQDDGVITAADGSQPALDQTVMGVAPPPSGVTPAGSAPRAPIRADVPAVADGSTLVAAPVIAVADPRAPVPAAELEVPPAPPPAVSNLGTTLPMARSLAPVVSESQETQASAEPSANGIAGLAHTALSADYLRAARDEALTRLAEGPAAPNESRDVGSSPDAFAPQQPAIEAPPSGGTRPSIVASFTDPAPAPIGAERTGPTSVRGFEPVPVVRAPLAESLSGAFGPIAELGGHRNFPPAMRPLPTPARSRDAGGRWLLLGSVALATVGVVTLGSRLWDRYRAPTARIHTVAAAEGFAESTEAATANPSTAASRAMLANRPAPQRGIVDGRARVVSATGAPGVRAGIEETPPVASASPESQLAATAGRHVLTGNYAEALPVYRQLERGWPENTAYAAMARLLEKRLGSTNDTRTITPTTPSR